MKQGFQGEKPWIMLEGRPEPQLRITETLREDGTRMVETTWANSEPQTLVHGQRVTEYAFNTYTDGVQRFRAPERRMRLDNGYQ